MRIDTMFNQAQAHLTEYYDDHRLFDPLLLLLPQDTCNASIYIYISLIHEFLHPFLFHSFTIVLTRDYYFYIQKINNV